MKQKIVISENIKHDLGYLLSDEEYDKLFILVDVCTKTKCLPLISGIKELEQAEIITIEEGDDNKNLQTLSKVWHELCEKGATRKSCIINLGGGMVTDLGGFASSTFKRGIRFINIPTTLLAMVDASVGGKTGINFNGLKNEIGCFSNAEDVIISTKFLQTLDERNICSGYAEMIKHGLISDEGTWGELMLFDIANPNLSELGKMVGKSINIKERFINADPQEHGIRKALNFGHTAGHAFEELSLKNGTPLPHGYAVAFGMVCELYLSCIKLGFPTKKMRQTVGYIKEHYGFGSFKLTCDEYKILISLMKHDKKNVSGIINFTLLEDIGQLRINQTASNEEIVEAFDFLREC